MMAGRQHEGAARPLSASQHPGAGGRGSGQGQRGRHCFFSGPSTSEQAWGPPLMLPEASAAGSFVQLCPFVTAGGWAGRQHAGVLGADQPLLTGQWAGCHSADKAQHTCEPALLMVPARWAVASAPSSAPPPRSLYSFLENIRCSRWIILFCIYILYCIFEDDLWFCKRNTKICLLLVSLDHWIGHRIRTLTLWFSTKSLITLCWRQ